VKESRRQLKRFVKDAEATLKDLRTTVRAVESKRDKFLHIDDEELYDRRALVDSSLDRIANVKAAMHSNEVKGKLLADERNLNLRRGGTNQEMTDLEKEETAFIADSQANTTMMLQQQDDTLEDLDDAVQRVGYMADNIHEELGQQNKMLEHLDDDLADAEEKLGLVMGKLAKFLKTNSKWHLGSIACLVLVVIILFMLVIYT
jgi:syntaxin 6